MPKRSLFTTLLWALVVAVSVGGCGTGEPADTAVRAAAASNGDRQRAAVQEGRELVSCQALIDGGWSAPEGDPSLYYDPDTGFVDVTFGPEEMMRVDLVNDPVCDQLPDIGPLLARVSGDYELMRVQECTEAVQDVAHGVVPRKGDIVGDLDALRSHILEWCPASFAAELRRLDGSVNP